MRRRISKPSSSPSPALARLGLATPPPFVGRDQELAELSTAVTGSPIVVINGAVGTGKTRLAGEFAARVELAGDLQVTRVACAPGDLGVAVAARCERALDRMPGSLLTVLHQETRLLIIDDVHHLPSVDVARLVSEVAERPGVGRLLLLSRDVLPLPRDDSRRWTLALEGLDETAAHDLWSHLENLYGPTRQGACDRALSKTRGMPLALRREYARSRYGADAWELECLPAPVRSALQAVSVARLPVGPAAVSVLVSESEVEPALIDLVSRQLIDPLTCGRFAVHDVVRDQVLHAMSADLRTSLERRAVELIRGTGRGVGPQRPAWTAGDDGAIALLDEVDRAREILLHLLAAGDYDDAVAELEVCARGALARGAGGELLAHIEHLRQLGVDNAATARIAAQVAVRHGRIAEAIELGRELEPTVQAYLRFRAGEVKVARETLSLLCAADSLDAQARAASALSEIELLCGNPERADAVLTAAFEHRGNLSRSSRTTLHLAFARLETHRGNSCGARAALSRAASSADDLEQAAQVSVGQVRNLTEERRFAEARKMRERVEASVAEVDCIPLRDALVACEALMESQIGDARQAIDSLQTVIAAARERGDEVGALLHEVELIRICVVAGQLHTAASSVQSVSQTASSFGLEALSAHAKILGVAVAISELRIELASEQLDSIDESCLSHSATRLATSLRREIDARTGGPEVLDGATSLEVARLALARGQGAAALTAAKLAAVECERTGRIGDLAAALSIVGRLELARGAHEAATAASSRAARESLTCGCSTSRTEALLILSSLARDNGEVREAATYARDAKALAADAGLPVQHMIATQALEVIAGGERNTQAGSASAATATPTAIDVAERMLSDLGFSAVRPYRCVSACGGESFVASASPELLGVSERGLVVDAVRQVIVRKGETVADLRRRSLLKRLLFLFASAPSHVFSKEEIVEQVWEVEYHPLRHDAALFTNIMRIRRLLGDDGNDLIQVSEEGYGLIAPKDFLYVEERVQ